MNTRLEVGCYPASHLSTLPFHPFNYTDHSKEKIVIPDYPEAASFSREDVVRVKHFADRSLQQIGNPREWCFEVGGKVAPSAQLAASRALRAARNYAACV